MQVIRRARGSMVRVARRPFARPYAGNRACTGTNFRTGQNPAQRRNVVAVRLGRVRGRDDMANGALDTVAGTSTGMVCPSGRQGLRTASVAELVEGADEGLPEAWAELMDRFGNMITTVGRRYRLSPSDVAELQQTTWLRLLENISRIEHPERVGGWLATTARHESLAILRRAARYTVGVEQMLVNTPDAHLVEPEAGPIAAERDALLQKAMERLRPRCRELLALLFVDEPLGYKDLSTLLRMPVGSIGPTRARCLEHLRRLVAGADVEFP